MAMFTRRHYNAIGKAIADTTRNRVHRDGWEPDHECLTYIQAVIIPKLADLFEADNPNFIRERFWEAANPPDCKTGWADNV